MTEFRKLQWIFLDCLRSEFIEDVGKLDENCTLPWVQSMKGVLNYTEKITPTCNTLKDYSLVNERGLNFSAEASANNHSKCSGISLNHNFGSQILNLLRLYNPLLLT